MKFIWGVLMIVLAATAWSAQAEGRGKRQKVIDFEDEVVESMNKRPLDSLSHVAENERNRRKPHLYRKRASFRNETRETLDQLRYVP